MAENEKQGALQSMISCISTHFWSITGVWIESLGSFKLPFEIATQIFQHKVERTPHFTQLTGNVHIVNVQWSTTSDEFLNI